LDKKLEDELFVYKTMSTAFRVALDNLLKDYTDWIDNKSVKDAVIGLLLYRVEEADKYIQRELAKKAREDLKFTDN
jgi:hypothetical protein